MTADQNAANTLDQTGAQTEDATRRQRILDIYESRTTKLLSALALVYLVSFSMQQIFYYPQEQWFIWATWFSNFLWLLFVIDVVFRFLLAPNHRQFIRHNILDIVTVVVPQFRALRALRAFSKGGVLSNKRGALSGRAVAMAAMGTAIIVWVGSLLVLSAERGAPNAEIVNFPDALWWSFETITTVGYGDFVPVTWLGRFFAVFIMLLGISVLGVVSASLAATLVKQNQQAKAAQSQESEAGSRVDLAKDVDRAKDVDLAKEIAELKQMVAELKDHIKAQG